MIFREHFIPLFGRSSSNHCRLILGRKIRRNWKISMENMLQNAYGLRSIIGETATAIIDKLVCCSLDGFQHYIDENDQPHGCLSPKDMILWQDWNSCMESKFSAVLFLCFILMME
jgi:hypothetical protein